ncbi:ABC transporter permease [Alkalihalobacillus trypoxylicola]|uniref:ABC transporter permease n=1 Tax=Alkalihalobacillus trypoxylicola TaxID=519424 RepID=A0A161PFE2_9BACI|nr:ABC transporter permease [Alkalihalobacillus trypoxylicola]KYG31837.1 ABC transporter permease [Alkalihalobacillus trypoxylicola]
MDNSMSLWKGRVSTYWNEAIRYLRLIANSGFLFTVYVLILIGSSYYSQILKELPEQFPTIWIFTILFGLFLTKTKIRTFLKQADIVFLIPYESNMKSYFKASIIYSWVWHIFYLFLLFVLLLPLYQLRLAEEAGDFWYVFIWLIFVKGWNVITSWTEQRLQSESERISHFSLRLIVNLALTYLLFSGANFIYLLSIIILMATLYVFYYQAIAKKRSLKWDRLVDVEERMVMFFYRIANVFAEVPQLRGKVRHRVYLNPIVNGLTGSKRSVYQYLFSRSFIRSNDYLGIYIRLVGIAGLFLYGFQISWVQMILFLLFTHMVMMQLSTLWFHYDTNIWVDLYPINEDDKKQALTKLSFRMLMIMTLFLFIILLWSSSIGSALMILIIGIVFSYIASHHLIHRRKRKRA